MALLPNTCRPAVDDTPPRACSRALEAKLAEAGIKLKIAIVLGDDLLDRAAEFRAAGTREMFSGAEMSENLWSMNAYLGAGPIAAALDQGADIVITGRCVDSAVTLGPLPATAMVAECSSSVTPGPTRVTPSKWPRSRSTTMRARPLYPSA